MNLAAFLFKSVYVVFVSASFFNQIHGGEHGFGLILFLCEKAIKEKEKQARILMGRKEERRKEM